MGSCTDIECVPLIIWYGQGWQGWVADRCAGAADPLYIVCSFHYL